MRVGFIISRLLLLLRELAFFNARIKVYVFILLLSVNSFATYQKVPVSVVRVESTHIGYGILSKVPNIGIVVLTNSHLLKGKPNANITLSFINNIELPYNLDASNVPKKITLLAESIQKTDDPVGDIILLKLKWNHLLPDLRLRTYIPQFGIVKIHEPNSF